MEGEDWRYNEELPVGPVAPVARIWPLKPGKSSTSVKISTFSPTDQKLLADLWGRLGHSSLDTPGNQSS